MAGGGGGGGGKRDVNAELNLVSYIDLLSTLIVFLLITAVWNQLAALSTNGQNASASESSAPPTPPDPNKIDFSVSVFLDRIEAKAGKDLKNIPHIAGEPDFSSLMGVLKSWRQQWPDRRDVTVNTDSQAPYKHLIKVMDTLTETSFEDVGVNTQ